jgi:DNA primase
VEAVHARAVDEVYAGMQLVQVRLRAVDRRIREVQGTMARLGAGGDPERYAAVANELWVLQQYAQSLRNQGAAAL